MENFPIARHLVLAGGGHSHVIFLKMLGMQPVPGLKVTLVSPETSTPYSGMLPGLIAGHYVPEEVYIDLVPLCRFAGADFVRGRVGGLDPEQRIVRLAERPDLHYDLLSIDIGSTPALGSLDAGAVIPVKPIGELLQKWQAFLDSLAQGGISDVGFVGAGAGGVEMCLAVNHALQAAGYRCRLHLFTDGKTILREYPANVRIAFERTLDQQSIEVHRAFRATASAAGELVAEDGRRVRLDRIFWITQAGAQAWPANAGLDVDANGFIRTRDSLQTLKHDSIFAVGDCATMVNHPRPKAGVHAVRQGKPLYRNIRALLLGEQLKAFAPQQSFLSLITTGPRTAVASRNGLMASGDWVWRWKNWIDQRFMQQFTKLPVMRSAAGNALLAEFDEQMHCGGCGAKVSADLLRETLVELLGADHVPADDAVTVAIPPGRQLLQSVDHLRAFVSDPYLQARIAVCHAVSDIYACGGTGHSAMAMLTLPFAKPGVTRNLLHQVMSGTLHQLAAEGMALTGGHTSEGMEMSLGFAVNGLVSEGRRWDKQGLEAGDALILTKALGTGTIMAADMQYRAKGAWVEAAIQSMLMSNRQVVDALAGLEIHAATDVTGFGLAGHLREMISGTGRGAALNLSSIPRLAGADECLHDLGIQSTLHGANRTAAAVGNLIDAAEILFDPQTSGGLLIGLSPESAEPAVTALQAAGFSSAAIIGMVNETGEITVTLEE